MKIAVITIVSGRRRHLERQHAALAASTVVPDLYTVVSMGDDGLASWRPQSSPHPLLETIEVVGTGLPLAAARNRGAARALAASAELLVFLDVDCIPAEGLVEGYLDAATKHPEAVLSGAVGYLPEDCNYGDRTSFGRVARFHDFRPRLAMGEVRPAEPRLFWSLSFAVTASTWKRIGGFCEQYLGYGGEDTDFGLSAAQCGIESFWVGGAEAFHQYHPTSSPPVDHLDDILTNGAVFKRRWGFWPMEGWMQQFEQMGLIAKMQQNGDWARVADRA